MQRVCAFFLGEFQAPLGGRGGRRRRDCMSTLRALAARPGAGNRSEDGPVRAPADASAGPSSGRGEPCGSRRCDAARGTPHARRKLTAWRSAKSSASSRLRAGFSLFFAVPLVSVPAVHVTWYAAVSTAGSAAGAVLPVSGSGSAAGCSVSGSASGLTASTSGSRAGVVEVSSQSRIRSGSGAHAAAITAIASRYPNRYPEALDKEKGLNGRRSSPCVCCVFLVGVDGFEPPTSSSQS